MRVILFSLLVLIAARVGAQAPDPNFQTDWSPNEYRIACRQDKPCMLDAEDGAYVIDMLKRAVTDFSATPFRTPRWWSPRRVDESDGTDYIELLDSGANKLAHVSCVFIPGVGSIEKAVLNVGNQFEYLRDYGADHMSYSHLVHELFHLSQYEYPIWDPARCNAHGGVPGWLSESMAQAFGIHMMEKQFPEDWPPMRSESEVVDMAGLRPYYKTLPIRIYEDGKEKTSGEPIFYRTHSFWRHVAEVHHGGKYDFLARYMKRPQPAGNNWVSWLYSSALLVTGTPLGIVFSGFLADYAGWGDEGYPGQLLGREKWLTGAFAGCKTIYLNKEEPFDYVEVDLQPIAGNCIEVVVAAMGPNGIAEGESAAIQVAAMIMTGSSSARGGIHLGLAASNDKRDFLCAREAKNGRKKGVGKCLFTPDDGKIRFGGGEVEARVWEVIAQELGKESRSGELRNLYTVSYTPTQISMRDSNYSSKDSVFVRLYFVLDVAKVAVEGEAKKGAVGSVGTPNADPQTTLPKRDASGKLVSSFSKPDQFQPPFPIAGNLPPQSEGKLAYFTVTTSADNADSTTGLMMMPLKTGAGGKLEGHPLSVGETGSFPLMIQAGIEQVPAVSLEGASLEVMEFTDLMFRARFSGTLCRHSDLVSSRPGVVPENPCRKPFSVSGEIVKAFAGSRLPGRFMVTERTDGTEMYRKVNEQAMAEWINPPSSSEDPDSGSTGPAGSSGTGGELSDCACTCEERSGTLAKAEELKTREARGEAINAGGIMGLMRCESQCRSEYVLCAMEEGKQEKAQKAASQAERQEQLKDECDCSCEAMNGVQSRLEELITDGMAGTASGLTQLQRLGECMQVCQGALMNCAR